MSYLFYSSLHLISLLSLALVLGSLWGIYTQSNCNPKIRSLLLSLHGIIMFFILLAGFGLMAKIKLSFPWPFWIYIKLLIWFLLGASPFLIKKSGQKFFSKPNYHKLSFLFIFCLLLIGVLSVKLKF